MNLSKYQKLTEIEHITARPGMYLGSCSNTKNSFFVVENQKMVEKEVGFNPALIKMLDEILSNSVDEHIRSGNVTKLDVSYSRLTGEIIISDNGGIPVQIHPKYKTYIPTMIFSELRTGSNFSDDERFSAGLNGLGAKLTSVFSKYFKVVTSDGTKQLTQIFENNLSIKHEPIIVPSNKKGTTITFIPDYERLNCELDDGNIARLERRVYDVAGCNPKIKVTLNNQQINIKSFADYVSLFCSDFIGDQNDHWQIAVSASKDDSFKQISFVNGVDTFNGGSHIDYITNQITNHLRDYIKKKHKIDVKPNNIKQQLFLFINCKINAPMFTSQTKEFMSTDVKDFGTSIELSQKFFKNLIQSTVVEKILDWAESQQRQKELAELRKINKQTQTQNYLKKIVKFDDASSKNRQDCICVLTEGDSASKSVLSSRDPKTIGVFPLKGKPLNVRDVAISKITSNEEFANILSIVGLKLGHECKKEDLRFGKILIAADSDPDGQHITGLIINMIQQFWPNLLTDGLLYRLKTPLLVVTAGKQKIECFSRSEYNKWVDANQDTKHSVKYYKGLGGWETKDFKRFLTEKKYQEPIIFADEQDFKCIDLAFDKRKADERKEWLAQ